MTQKNLHQYIPQRIHVQWHENVALFEVSPSEIVEISTALYNKNLPLKFITATDERKEHGVFKIFYIFGVPKENIFIIPFISLQHTNEFPSISLSIHEAWNYERKIRTFFGLNPVGHPDSRSLILHENWPSTIFPLRKDFQWEDRPQSASGSYAFEKIEGEGIYEISVGPIHAGIIEPGHFRFNVAGEEILLLEARLGFVHKGTEKLFEVLPFSKKIKLSEKISGDSSFSHSLAFCQAIESLSSLSLSKQSHLLRVIYAELERMANHIGDIGAIMIDTGFNFGGAHGARLREMLMQINEQLTGSRFLRGVNVVGGITHIIHEKQKKELLNNLRNIMKDFSEIIAIAKDTASLLNRLEGTGILSTEAATDHGVIGVAGKALGKSHDARVDFPYAAYDEITLHEIATEHTGDVYARFCVRIKEVYSSYQLIVNALKELPQEGKPAPLLESITLKKNGFAVSIVEGWRGDIIYMVTTDAKGVINRVAVRDPSFLNWAAVGHTGHGNIVPDFPLINKSFNLSYSGNDL